MLLKSSDYRKQFAILIGLHIGKKRSATQPRTLKVVEI